MDSIQSRLMLGHHELASWKTNFIVRSNRLGDLAGNSCFLRLDLLANQSLHAARNTTPSLDRSVSATSFNFSFLAEKVLRLPDMNTTSVACPFCNSIQCAELLLAIP